MAKKKKSSKKRMPKVNIAMGLAGLNAAFQYIEPFITAGAVEAARAGDWNGFVRSLRTGSKESGSLQNHLQALGPLAGAALMRHVLRRMNVRSPTVLGVAKVF